jgi:protoporphyrinogen oxidase
MSSRFTRREVLASFLGIPVALAACRSNVVPPLPAGEIIGASDKLGHKLRDGVKLEPSSDRWQRAKVVIVGGGVAGLSAARRLLKNGFDDFVLLELEPAPGGTSRSGSNAAAVVPYPWGAHYVPAPLKHNVELIELLSEMGVVEKIGDTGEPLIAEQFLCRDPEERVFYKGRWYEGLYLHAGATPDDQAQFDRFNREMAFWIDWRDSKGRRAFSIPISTSSDDAEVKALDKMSMAAWLDARGLNSSRLRWLIDYSCRDDYGLTVDQTSAWAGIFYFASRVEKGGTDSQPLITWPEGNGHLVSHLYNQTKSKVRLGYAVADLVPVDAGGVDVIAMDAQGSPVGIHADRVILAAPQFLSRYLIRPFREKPPSHVAEFQYGVWMVANLVLSDRPKDRGFPLAWDNVLYESPALGYVVATHQRGLDRGPTVFTYYYPMCDDDPRTARTRLLGMSWSECADVALTDLSRAHPEIRTLVKRLDVMRWGHAMIRPRPGFMWSGARAQAQQPFRGIHFANTDLSGIAIFEEAFHHGLRAADEVLEELRA